MKLILTLAFLFASGSIFGWTAEVIYRRLFSRKQWVNPGYLTGPCLPIYGTALCIMYLIAECEKHIAFGNEIAEKLLLYVLMALSVTAVEYLVGSFFLNISKVRLWDYSNHRGNINGVICPLYTFYWSVLGAIYCFALHARLRELTAAMSENIACIFALGAFYGILAVDLIYSAELMAKLIKFAREGGIVILFDELREDAAKMLTRYGKPAFLQRFPTGDGLREALESYRDRYFDKMKIKELLGLNKRKDKKQ